MLNKDGGAWTETVRGGVGKVFCVADKYFDVCFEFVCEMFHLLFVEIGAGEERFGVEAFARFFWKGGMEEVDGRWLVEESTLDVECELFHVI